MKHKPAMGMIPPRAAARISYDPPFDADEQPMLFTITGTNTVGMEIASDRNVILLTNLTDKHAPFVLVVAKNNPSLATLFDLLRQRLGG